MASVAAGVLTLWCRFLDLILSANSTTGDLAVQRERPKHDVEATSVLLAGCKATASIFMAHRFGTARTLSAAKDR